MTITTTQPVTAEALFARGGIGRCELIAGEVINMAPAGAEHGEIALELGYRIKQYADTHHLGKVYAAETGFTIARNPDTTRAPDVAFVRAQRLPPTSPRGFFEGPPDLAVEVVSPSDSHAELSAKVEQWLSAGAVSVWVVDPANRTIDVHRAGQPILRLRAGDELRDEPALPGFTLRVEDVFTATM
jgi:Uma2 family endonuclease